jgi:hypothetical protein
MPIYIHTFIQETDLEPITYKTTKMNRLVCNIENVTSGTGGNSNVVNIDHLQDGVKLGIFMSFTHAYLRPCLYLLRII